MPIECATSRVNFNANWVTLMCQCWLININYNNEPFWYRISVVVEAAGVCVCMSVWELTAKFCCELRTALKNNLLKNYTHSLRKHQNCRKV